MKRILLLLSISVLFITTNFAQSFESDRLPIGDSNKKYDFCAVKIDEIFNTNTNGKSSFDEMINDLKQKRIVMIGETHTNQLHHDVQLEVIKGLVDAGKPVVLALEMYNPNQNEVLEAWSSGNTDANTFMKQTDFLTTWSHNYRYYKAIFDYAREKHIPMYGANVERNYASKIGRGGLSSLSNDDINFLPHIDISTVEHKFLIKVLMQGMDATMAKQFENMYPAQSLWDAAMGEGAIEAAHKHPDATVVVLAGSGHVIYNIGIGRIIADRSNLSFSSVVTVDIPEEVEESGMMKVRKEVKKEMNKKEKPQMKHEGMPKEKMKAVTKTMGEKTKDKPSAHSMGMMMDDTPYRIVVKSYADYLFGKKEEEHEKYPTFGMSIKEKEGDGFPIKRILPETIAFENGLQTGDIIFSIDNNNFENLFELKRYLQFRNWDDEISFVIQREETKTDVTFVIKPLEDDE